MQEPDNIWLDPNSRPGPDEENAARLQSFELPLEADQANPVELLFELPDSMAADHRIIALLDAGRIFGLPEILQARDMPHASLFQEGLRDDAPYLVQLAPQDRLARQLLDGRDGPSSLLHADAGIFFRTGLEITALRRHLRRLMRVRDDADRAFFFRFWEPWAARHYFGQIAHSPQHVLHWFMTAEGSPVGRILVPDPGQARIITFSAEGLEGAVRPHVPFRIGEAELQALQQARLRADLERILWLIADSFPDLWADLGCERLEREVTRSIRRMQDFGIRQSDNLMRLATWDLHSDGRVESRDQQGRLRTILESALPEAQKMQALTERIAELEDQTASPGRLS